MLYIYSTMHNTCIHTYCIYCIPNLTLIIKCCFCIFVICSAIKTGTQMLELDVHLSKDKKVVVSHDADLSRCTGSTSQISDVDYKVWFTFYYRYVFSNKPVVLMLIDI